jgi:VIT1/CCC1 family predicted Fe2+/Mn2+ transporter
MGKYTYGVYITAFATGVLVASLTSNYVAGVASSFVVFGLAYMITGTIETILKVIKSLKE